MDYISWLKGEEIASDATKASYQLKQSLQHRMPIEIRHQYTEEEKQKKLKKLRQYPRGSVHTKLEKRRVFESSKDEVDAVSDPWNWETKAEKVGEKYGIGVDRGTFRDRLEEKSRSAQDAYGVEKGLFEDLFPEKLEASVGV